MSKQNNASLADFLDFMSRKGLNTTSQRRVIAEAFFELPGHHSLEEFYQYILGRDPGIGQTTVYRTLKLLCDAGLAMEIHFSDGITRYEVARPTATTTISSASPAAKSWKSAISASKNCSVNWRKSTGSA